MTWKFEQQIAAIASRDQMRRFIDQIEDGDHAVLVVWRADGTKRFVQYGMTVIAEVTHMLGAFWSDFISGSWPTNDAESEE